MEGQDQVRCAISQRPQRHWRSERRLSPWTGQRGWNADPPLLYRPLSRTRDSSTHTHTHTHTEQKWPLVSLFSSARLFFHLSIGGPHWPFYSIALITFDCGSASFQRPRADLFLFYSTVWRRLHGHFAAAVSTLTPRLLAGAKEKPGKTR